MFVVICILLVRGRRGLRMRRGGPGRCGRRGGRFGGCRRRDAEETLVAALPPPPAYEEKKAVPALAPAQQPGPGFKMIQTLEHSEDKMHELQVFWEE